ncbi:MAG TPA: hypothetical protein VGR35_14490 [Tepidisphaeraceae bacterium]|nr:hypothetical protein [Tepidisphaeraceae bacterium]
MVRQVWLFLLLLLVVTTGCSSQPTLSSWQRSISSYVRETGDGDPLVLRDMTLPENRPGFSVIGHHDTTASTDVNGLLLGHEQVGNRMWFVYLVGVVEKERVTDIRLAAVSMENGKTTWKRGKESEQALNMYRRYGLKQAKERFPNRKTPPPRYTGFPRPDDVFELTKANEKLVATHKASGARWELSLPRKER